MSARRRRPHPLEVLNASRLATLKRARTAGIGAVKRTLLDAQRDLERRLKLRGDEDDSFTAAQMRVTLEHIKQLVQDIKHGLGTTVLDEVDATALSASKDTVKYFEAANAAHLGVAERPLAINTAMVFDQSVSGTRSSILNRIVSDPDHPAQPGVIDRYGEAVIAKFERTMAQRLVTGKPWGEVRKELVGSSSFLQGSPMSWAERILRTETMYAHNRAGLETMQAIDKQTGGGSVKILCATFDNRTGADSYAVHGQIRRLNEPFDWWGGQYMNPPNRPNDREVVVPHRIEWPIPASLEPKSNGEVAARWREEGRKGSPPPRPKMSTVPRAQFGKS